MTTQGELCFAPNAVNQWKRKMERSSAFAAKWNFLKIWPRICALYSLRGPLNPRISHSRRNLDIASEEGGIAPVVESGCKRKIRGLSDVHSVMEIWQDTSVNWLNYILTSKTSSSGWHRRSCPCFFLLRVLCALCVLCVNSLFVFTSLLPCLIPSFPVKTTSCPKIPSSSSASCPAPPPTASKPL